MAAFEQNSHGRRAPGWQVRQRTTNMGKPTGFMEYRAAASRRSAIPQERIHDWSEFHDHLPETTLQEQGARCMDCGVPVLPHRAR